VESDVGARSAEPGTDLLTFERLAARADNVIDVALGATLLARDVYPQLDVSETLSRFDELAYPLLRRELPNRGVRAQAQHLAQHIYETCGFRGNEESYYDPKNSLICDVLDRRLGIPITLGIVYCEIAKRLGVTARGVGFPGHFLVRLESEREAPLFIDPFSGGRVLSDDGLARLHTRALGREGPIAAELLAPASSRMVLHRMLVNLRAIYLSRGDMARAMLVIDRILSLTPNAPEPLRERGLLSARLGAHAQALSDLERFLELSPQAEDAAQIRARLDELRAKSVTLN
jgi:regulator of sirC expression with transglutaminase-like and TPR domain